MHVSSEGFGLFYNGRDFTSVNGKARKQGLLSSCTSKVVTAHNQRSGRRAPFSALLPLEAEFKRLLVAQSSHEDYSYLINRPIACLVIDDDGQMMPVVTKDGALPGSSSQHVQHVQHASVLWPLMRSRSRLVFLIPVRVAHNPIPPDHDSSVSHQD